MTDVSVQLPEIKMQGRSGCKLDVIKEGEHVIIKKYSCSPDYNQRLLKQANKQQSFYNSLSPGDSFSTAKVLEICASDSSLAWFTMPYLFSEKYSDYLEKASIVDLKSLVDNLINYFSYNIKNASPQTPDAYIISSKIADLEYKISSTTVVSDKVSFFSGLQYLKNSVPDGFLPFGCCHGDLTFSNILFSDNKIYLLDFLDSFIESPLIDIVKLRQDTCFKWSIMLEKEMPSHKRNKLIQTFNYFDREIALFCNTIQLNEWYNYLQVFNLLRIVPYLTDRDEMLFIEKSLRQIIA